MTGTHGRGFEMKDRTLNFFLTNVMTFYGSCVLRKVSSRYIRGSFM